MMKALAHVCLLSRDLNRTLEFYTETLGLSKGFDFVRNGALFGFYLRVGTGQGSARDLGTIRPRADWSPPALPATTPLPAAISCRDSQSWTKLKFVNRFAQQ